MKKLIEDYKEIEDFIYQKRSEDIVCASSNRYKLVYTHIGRVYSVLSPSKEYLYSGDCEKAVEIFNEVAE